MTATDPAATLRRLAEQFDSHDGWKIDEDMDIYSWLLKSPDGSIKARCYARVTAERIAWLFNNDLELIAALERAPATDVDPAATLRRLADATSAPPWTVRVDRGDASVWRRPARLGGDPEDRLIGEVWDEGDAQFVAWCRNNAEAIATALEWGAAASSCRSEAGDSFDRLAMALMESIERGEDQLIQLERIGNACNDVDNWDDEAEALWVRAKAAAAKNAADRERGAAAERFCVLTRANWQAHGSRMAGNELVAALAVYDALTEGKPTDG